MPCPEPWGKAMRRRLRASAASDKPRRRRTATSKGGNALKLGIRRSATAGQKTEIALLTRELNEAREQQIATTEVLRVISSSLGELEPVFNAMLANATRICEAKFGSLYLY